MGVPATFRQHCALAAQHDHDVTAVEGGLRSFRGLLGNEGRDRAGEPEQPFPFGGRASNSRGSVEDGGFDVLGWPWR
jgi:hypothetical protein